MKKLTVSAAVLIFSMLSGGATVDEKPAQNEKVDEKFTTVDIFIDSGSNPLAAWQVELTYKADNVKVLSLEGGDDSFAQPPHYDPTGMIGGKLIVAAFSTDDAKAPSGVIRVARLHIMTIGPVDRIQINLTTACKPGGEKIKAKVKLAEANKSVGCVEQRDDAPFSYDSQNTPPWVAWLTPRRLRGNHELSPVNHAYPTVKLWREPCHPVSETREKNV